MTASHPCKARARRAGGGRAAGGRNHRRAGESFLMQRVCWCIRCGAAVGAAILPLSFPLPLFLLSLAYLLPLSIPCPSIALFLTHFIPCTLLPFSPFTLPSYLSTSHPCTFISLFTFITFSPIPFYSLPIPFTPYTSHSLSFLPHSLPIPLFILSFVYPSSALPCLKIITGLSLPQRNLLKRIVIKPFSSSPSHPPFSSLVFLFLVPLFLISSFPYLLLSSFTFLPSLLSILSLFFFPLSIFPSPLPFFHTFPLSFLSITLSLSSFSPPFPPYFPSLHLFPLSIFSISSSLFFILSISTAPPLPLFSSPFPSSL